MTRTGESPGEESILSESVSVKRLVNILNHVNFRENTVVVNFRRFRDGGTLSLKAAPEPCEDNTVRLFWREKPPKSLEKAYEFADFFIDRGSRVVIVDGHATNIDDSGITVLLPRHCRATSRRRSERFSSVPVHATLSGDESEATGLLKDFGGGFLKVRFPANEARLFFGKRRMPPIRVVLRRKEAIVYEGSGSVERRIAVGEHADLVVRLEAPREDISTEEPEAALAPPALIAVCRHPLSDKIVRLHVARATYNTFIVREDPARITLFPGLIIPEVGIDFGAGDSARCTTKIVGGRSGTWLMSVVDMPVLDQRKLFSFIEKEAGISSGVSTVIDPEDLIQFFFEAGFIYPKKYAGMSHSRERLREMLSHLYIDTPSVSQHFVMDDGREVIQAHISMIRFYERSWIIHHYAALGQRGAGSAILAQVFRYVDSYGSLPSSHMEYLMCYYRRENRFPNRIFGGFARSLDTRSLCSVDSFAYFHVGFGEGGGKGTNGERGWKLEPASRGDLLELETVYEGISGGLMLKAFDIEVSSRAREAADLDAEFAKAGLRRRKSVFALKREGRLKSVIMAVDSDAGLNMSGLMKSLHVFIVDEKGLSFDQLVGQLKKLSFLYEEPEIPVLAFPSWYVTDQGAPYEKIYDLLVFRTSVVKEFIEFAERLTNRLVRRKTQTQMTDSEGEASGQ